MYSNHRQRARGWGALAAALTLVAVTPVVASAAYSVNTTAVWTSGQNFTVTYSDTVPSPAPPGPPTQDYIGLYAIGDPDGTYQAFKYVPTGVRNGSVTFTAPTTTGHYEVRYQPYSNGYNHTATKGLSVQAAAGSYALINVPDTVFVGPSGRLLGVGSITGSGSPAPGPFPTQDYVGLYVRSAPDGSYLAFGYFAAGVNSSASFTIPGSVPAGTYQLRYQPYWNGYNNKAKRWIQITK